MGAYLRLVSRMSCKGSGKRQCKSKENRYLLKINNRLINIDYICDYMRLLMYDYISGYIKLFECPLDFDPMSL